MLSNFLLDPKLICANKVSRMTHEMIWIQLKQHNDWGVVYFSRPGKGLSVHGMASARKYGLPFQNGDELDILWPDGSQTKELVALKTYHEKVGDHGNSYPVSYELPGILVEFRGIAYWRSLVEVKVSEASLEHIEKRMSHVE